MAPGNDNLVKHAYAGIYNINGKWNTVEQPDIKNVTRNQFSSLSVLLVEETRLSIVLWENHQPVASYWQTWSDNVVSSAPQSCR
jgi:hypothetical protein